MGMTIPIGNTLIIKHNNKIIFQDNAVSYKIGLKKSNKYIIRKLQELYSISYGYNFVFDNMNFEKCGYNIDELTFHIENHSCNNFIGCTKPNECNR